MIIKILKNILEQFPVFKKKLHIVQDDIKKYIKRYHNPSKYEHSEIVNIIKIIQRNYYFLNIRE